MTPDFAEWLLSTYPEAERAGRVFKLLDLRAKTPLPPHRPRFGGSHWLIEHRWIIVGRKKTGLIRSLQLNRRRAARLTDFVGGVGDLTHRSLKTAAIQ